MAFESLTGAIFDGLLFLSFIHHVCDVVLGLFIDVFCHGRRIEEEILFCSLCFVRDDTLPVESYLRYAKIAWCEVAKTRGRIGGSK